MELYNLTPEQKLFLHNYKNSWYYTRRPEQAPPEGDWKRWLIITGRGWGKTRAGAEWVRNYCLSHQGARVGLIGATAADVRDTMVDGESGLLAVCRNDNITYLPSKRRVEFLKTGSRAIFYSAEKPRQLRGPQHHAVWCDELCAWQYLSTMLYNIDYGLRLGPNPQMLVSTTPQPSKELKALVNSPNTILTTGSTFDNANNLPESFINDVKSKYEGTTIGKQELYGIILDGFEGALWKQSHFQRLSRHDIETFEGHTIISIDPALTSKVTSDLTGIVVIKFNSALNRFIVVEDLSCQETPLRWAKIAVDALQRHRSLYIVYESNAGGDLVKTIINEIDPQVYCKPIHSAVSKRERMLPIFGLYEQGKVFHSYGLELLEEEMTEWEPERSASPNRIDAVVHGITYITTSARKPVYF